MIDFIHAGCQVWGRQVHWLHFGKDGWATRSMIGKLMEEGNIGAGSDRFTHDYKEVLRGDAVKYNNAIKTLSEQDRAILFVRYVIRGCGGKVKAAKMRLAARTYYAQIDLAHKNLWRALAAQESRFLCNTDTASLVENRYEMNEHSKAG